MKIDFKKLTREFTDIEMKVISDSFNEWCQNSGYVTGSWSTGEDVDPDKKREYYDFLRMTALEQLLSVIKKNLKICNQSQKQN